MEQSTTELTPFQLALQKREQQKKEQEEAKNTSNWSTDYEQVEVVGLVDQKEIVGRMIGNPIEARSKSTDPKMILQSEIVKDDKKGYWKLNWPWKEIKGYINPDPDWLPTKFMDKVFEGKVTKYTEADIDGKNIIKKDGKIVNIKNRDKEWYWKYYNENTKIFEWLKNNSKIDEKFPKSFEPTKRIVCNWIDRHDDWCKENKHSKLLSARKSPYEIIKEDGTKTTIYFTDTGIPNSLYDMIIDHCKSIGTLDIDLVLIKDVKTQAKYKVWDITDVKYISDASVKIGKKESLSKEEKEYELYDLDKLYGVSSYHKIKKVLGSRMALCDAELGTNFVNQLNDLVEKERKEWEENKVYYYHPESDCVGICTKEEFSQDCVELTKEEYDKKKKELESISKSKVEDESNNEKVESVEQGEPTKRKRTKDEAINDVVQQANLEEKIRNDCKTNFPYWESLQQEEQYIMIESIASFEGKMPIYKDKNHPGCSNRECYYEGTKTVTLVPDGVNICPVCGTIFS